MNSPKKLNKNQEIFGNFQKDQNCPKGQKWFLAF